MPLNVSLVSVSSIGRVAADHHSPAPSVAAVGKQCKYASIYTLATGLPVTTDLPLPQRLYCGISTSPQFR